MAFLTGRAALSNKLERATLNWFAMGEKDEEHLAEMRRCYRALLDHDTMAIALKEAGREMTEE